MKLLAIAFMTVSVIISIQSAQAYTQDEVDFASGLEETLGHFWAIELNLDENNAKLALVHATHPIAEIYTSLKPQLVEKDPALDDLVRTTLQDLQKKATTDVSRAQAQRAIDDAKDIIEQTRAAIVPKSSLDDPEFQLELVRILLETSVAEYYEAVQDGVIGNMPEFQDGSAFVVKSKQIFEEQRSYLGDTKSANIDAAYSELSDAYTQRADPTLVDEIVDRIISEIVVGSTERDLVTYVDTIKSLLEDTKTEYRMGNTDLALSLVTRAYLDNYEFLEQPLVDAGERELMEEVEIMLREELRDMIKSGEDADKIDEQIDAILIKMETVEKIVPEFGVMVMMVMAVAIGVTIVMTRRVRMIKSTI